VMLDGQPYNGKAHGAVRARLYTPMGDCSACRAGGRQASPGGCVRQRAAAVAVAGTQVTGHRELRRGWDVIQPHRRRGISI